MHTPDNQNTTSRTSAAQINEEELLKEELIMLGLKKEKAERFPGEDENFLMVMSYGALSCICASLTSRDKYEREWGKARVRELVKLGKGE